MSTPPPTRPRITIWIPCLCEPCDHLATVIDDDDLLICIGDSMTAFLSPTAACWNTFARPDVDGSRVSAVLREKSFVEDVLEVAFDETAVVSVTVRLGVQAAVAERARRSRRPQAPMERKR